jgi:streptomycin 6-kinase
MDTFENNIINIWGQQGKTWLIQLPSLIQQLAQQLHLQDLQPLGEHSYHYLLAGAQYGKAIVLKLGLDVMGMQREIKALRAFDGHGCVKLFEYLPAQNALLLELAIPGQSLKQLFPQQDKEAVEITCTIMHELHSAPIKDNLNFPTIAEWLKTLDKDHPLPLYHLQQARNLRTQLLATSTELVLLHGDLHHDNILSNGINKWIAIDPKGVIGEPAYEVGAFIRNPIPEIQTHPDLIKTRIKLFADNLSIDAQRIRDWSYVQCILAACWAVEDNMDPDDWLGLAEFF